MTSTATVEVLTAEVRVLMVGSRQVTLSVYRQLDAIPFYALTPFGRVRASRQPADEFSGGRIEVIGADRDGRLCRSWIFRTAGGAYHDPGGTFSNREAGEADWAKGSNLPLIVLAGLR